ncbi:unnamed protein product [Kluyveromyces dobzhanskii CBS 2104]|uniref:aspartyl aminopeptidase n=1 Tax=Kluyveromyces dobzhanskii CBS 2104 TaxID=1427455 RepID=A0A0A8LA44_9SACH|nr:unnamed protein product [Kluyveromyces dobzhanskii CBS 2104]
MSSASVTNYPQEFINFLNSSPTPYHAVHNVKTRLKSHGFVELKESDAWESQFKNLGKYFVTRNNSSIVAFVVGGKWKPGNPVAIVGAHTDSPVLRIKPISKRVSEGFSQIGVECYGGGIWHTWFDSDLSVAGRVLVWDEKEKKTVSKLVNLKKPLLKIPTLAIHLDRDVNTKFEFNKETQLLPISGLSIKDKKQETGSKDECCTGSKPLPEDQFSSLKSIIERHHEDLLKLICQDLHLEKVTDIEDFELILYDHKPSTLGGINEEFVFSGRLDNLTSCFTSMHGLTEAADTELATDEGIRMVAMFDHEEIGSSSAQGADSNFLPNILERVTPLVGTDEAQQVSASALLQSSAKSFFLSSDVAHAVHPNYSSKHESQHKPQFGAGPVVKINANQRYMTNSPGLVLISKLADEAQVPLQLFVGANNVPCGSTIGPILASKTGIRTLDLGNPILSMHSIRETGSAKDIELQVKLFRKFFERYSALQSTIEV